MTHMKRERKQQLFVFYIWERGESQEWNKSSFLITEGKEEDHKASVHHGSSEAFNWRCRAGGLEPGPGRAAPNENDLMPRTRTLKFCSRLSENHVQYHTDPKIQLWNTASLKSYRTQLPVPISIKLTSHLRVNPSGLRPSSRRDFNFEAVRHCTRCASQGSLTFS